MYYYPLRSQSILKQPMDGHIIGADIQTSKHPFVMGRIQMVLGACLRKDLSHPA